MIHEGWTPADEDGLASLVVRLGPDAIACVEMMSGAAWVRDMLQAAGWTVQIADARKAKAVGSLAAKIDKLDARVLAELARRDLVPQVHVSTFVARELRERLGRRMHMVRLQTAAISRAPGLLSRSASRSRSSASGIPIPMSCWPGAASPRCGVTRSLSRSRSCRCSTSRLIPLEQELRPLARADPRVQLLVTVPAIGDLLGLTIASEIGEISRFASARKLIGYSGLAAEQPLARALP